MVSPTIIPVGAEEVIGTNRTSTVLVGRTTLNGRPPVESTAADDVAAASGVLEGRMIKGSPPVEPIDESGTATEVGKTIEDGTRLVEPTDTAVRPPVELSPASTVDFGRTIDDGRRSVEPTDTAGRPPVELSLASTVDVGRTIDDGRPPVEPAPVSAVEIGKLTLGRSMT